MNKDVPVPCDGLDRRQCFWCPASGLNSGGSAERIALYHYVTKSRQDFAAKTKRGSGMSGATKREDYFQSVQQCAPACLPACA